MVKVAGFSAIVTEPLTGVRWWRAIPLGAVERLLALSEVITINDGGDSKPNTELILDRIGT